MNVPDADVVVVDLLPTQYDFVQAEQFEVMLSGAFGSGKSRGLCYKVLQHAMIPGNRVGLCRAELVALKSTTLKTLLEPEGDLPAVLPKGTYEHNKGEREIHIHGGGTIYYFGFDDERRTGSLNLGAIGVDEGIELNLDEYTMLLGRVRRRVDPYNQIFIATNPGSPSHFLYKRFFEEVDSERFVIESDSLSNPFLPEAYRRMLQGFTGITKERYVEGKWVAMEGLIYAYDRRLHCLERDGPFQEIVLGVDEGYTSPGVCLVIGFDSDGRAHVMEEFYETEVKPSVFVDHVEVVSRRTGATAVYVPPEAAGLIADLEAKGVPVCKADNSVLPGIREVQDRLLVAGDQRPRLTVQPSCVNTKREFVSYRWAKGSKEAPLKQDDHAMDALRYPLYTHGLRIGRRRSVRRGRILSV